MRRRTSRPDLSRHALRRMQQRGIRRELIDLIWQNHDVEAQVGDGCQSLTVSRRMRGKLREGDIAPELLDKGGKIVLVVGSDGRVITVLRNGRRRGRRYRRQFPTCRRP